MKQTFDWIDFGKRVHRARLQLNLMQKDFAERVGMSKSQISNIERGKQLDPGYVTIATLCLYLDIPFPNVLVREERDDEADDDLMAGMLSMAK